MVSGDFEFSLGPILGVLALQQHVQVVVQMLPLWFASVRFFLNTAISHTTFLTHIVVFREKTWGYAKQPPIKFA